MKYLAFILLIPFILTNCFAQEVARVTKRTNDFYLEKYQVLKADPNVKQGLYQAIARRKIAVASGAYNNGRKTGVWHFYDPAGTLLENYNYDTQTFVFEAPEDTASDLTYLIDNKRGNSDKFTKPLKIGGRYYGYVPFVAAFAFPYDTADVNTDSFNVEVQLLISPLGRLADYQVHVSSQLYKYDQTTIMSLALFKEEDKQFVPATFNNKPVLCRIVIKCYMTENGYLDFY